VIQDPLALAALIAGITAVAFWLDHTFPALSKLGASLLAIILGAILSNLGLVPVSSPVYDMITGPITSLAIAWLLLSVNLSDVKKAGPRMLGAYGLAALGTALGALAGAVFFGGVFGGDTWRLSGVLTGTFTGGSLNFVSVGRAVELPDRLFAGATAADALITGVWMGATLMLPVWLGRFFPPTPREAQSGAGGPAGVDEVQHSGEEDHPHTPGVGPAAHFDPEGVPHPFFLKEAVSTLDLAILGAVGVALLLGSSFLGTMIPQIPAILWLTTLSLLVGQLKGMARPQGAFPLGTLALHFFFVVIGIFSRVSEILAVGLEVFWLVLMVVAIHGVVVYGGGRLARLDVGTLSVASQRAGRGGIQGMAGAGPARNHRGIAGLRRRELLGRRGRGPCKKPWNWAMIGVLAP
jgi:uncharacterized membrane protein